MNKPASLERQAAKGLTLIQLMLILLAVGLVVAAAARYFSA